MTMRTVERTQVQCIIVHAKRYDPILIIVEIMKNGTKGLHAAFLFWKKPCEPQDSFFLRLKIYELRLIDIEIATSYSLLNIPLYGMGR
jgi:hypothetical protein